LLKVEFENFRVVGQKSFISLTSKQLFQGESRMSQTVEIDEIDAKILRALIKDARTRLKDIAKECGVSSNAIFKRVKRLKEAGVMKRATLLTNLSCLGYTHPATIGVSLNPDQEERVTKLIQNRRDLNLVALSQSVGKYDLFISLIAKSVDELDDLKDAIMKEHGVAHVSVNFWIRPRFNFENVSLNPKRAETHGQD
jgi:DNA-binding Lrp family transcriptional regulator